MSTLAPSTSDLASRLDRDVPAVEVRDLRKTFRRKDRKRGPLRAQASVAGARRRHASRSPVASASPSSARTARGSRRSSACSRRCCSPTAARRGSSATTSSEDASAIRRLVNRVSVEASFFKKMSAAENLVLRGALLRDDAAPDATSDPRDPRQGRLPAPSGAASRWRTCRAACSRRSRSRGRC